MSEIDELKKRIAAMENPTVNPVCDDISTKPRSRFKRGDRVLYEPTDGAPDMQRWYGIVLESDIDNTRIIHFSSKQPPDVDLEYMERNSYTSKVLPTKYFRAGWDDLKFKPGDKVHWIGDGEDKPENGMVKAMHTDGRHAFVVYKCDGNWDRYADYTGQLSLIDNLRHGWK